jgi:hypothetical protein
MKTLRMALAIVVVFIFGLPSQVLAHLEVFPTEHDFGDVEVGNSRSTSVTLMNLGDAEVGLDTALRCSADFAIVSTVPANISPGGIVDIEVVFTPSATGFVAADPLINGVAVTALGLLGVANEPPPPPSIVEILAFFDASVADGSLVGDGPAKSADGRRNALRNMLEATCDLIKDGNIADACKQLMDSYQRCDGLPRPPEFVAGPAAPAITEMIFDLMISLGCAI